MGAGICSRPFRGRSDTARHRYHHARDQECRLRNRQGPTRPSSRRTNSGFGDKSQARRRLVAAADGNRRQLFSLDAAIQALEGVGGSMSAPIKRRGRPPGTTNNPTAGGPKKRRGMSAAARKRIAEAMRKRWAAAKKSGKKRL